MPDIFPDSSPGSFTFDKQSGKWVMTVFNYYQWDLNYTNPEVFVAMLDNILFYANLGVDILRIDAPAFIWKQMGTSCQNLPEAHILLQLIKHCVQVSAPGMALLGEAIVAPAEIMKYFGTGKYTGRECDVAYNATHMALQWDALATGDTRVMLAAQPEIQQKPFGTTWITYTRCHDDIGLGYDDSTITTAGFTPFAHRSFLKEYYSGKLPGSPAKGALFGVNPKTNDARISGSLASLCGLETALENGIEAEITLATQKIMLMQAHSMFIGGIPVLFYGDECGYTNQYTYLQDPAKNYDNRWMHRPAIDWKKNANRKVRGTVEQRLFDQTKKLIALRKANIAFCDVANTEWLSLHNVHIAGYARKTREQTILCLFNFSNSETGLTWYALKEKGWQESTQITDLWTNQQHLVGPDNKHILLAPYQFMVLTDLPYRK
jgi:amylosucrase